MARARLGDLRKLVRDKAGFAGQDDHLILKVDVLAALDIAEEDDLLPTPQAFLDVGDVVERVQLQDFIDRLGTSGCWLIHATGGVGKTVFVQSIASKLAATDEVILFDCFGGGAYRSPVDGRHRPERGLLHIVNELACRGLCDPILPNATDPAEVIRRSLQRFSQTLATLRRVRPAARLVIIMDAADNAAIEARNRGQPSFPKDLLLALSHHASIEGLIVVASARTERSDLAIGRAACQGYELHPFVHSETAAFVKARRPEATAAQIEALAVRAEGNPRVIANLIEPDRSLVAETSVETKITLPELIKDRIQRAVALADQNGAQGDAIATFLCALSVLPPPVPVAEIASAFGLPISEIESLAADLAPLLERTRHGLIFRDEPTETLVSETYGTRLSLLDGVVERLGKAQETSVYAARALPGLLFAMGRVEMLHDLAFDQRFPPELSSDVAKRGIRLNRLKTALGAAAKAEDFDASVDLLVELSSVALADERGEDYLLGNADLAVAVGDTETLRRLFEIRTSWPGTRHARLSIAYSVEGTTADAYMQTVRAEEWLQWARAQTSELHDRVRPEIDDRVCIPFYLLAKGRFFDVGRVLAGWYGWYGFQLSERMLELARISHAIGKLPQLQKNLAQLGRCRYPPPALVVAAFTVFPELDIELSKKLLRGLATVDAKREELGENFQSYLEVDSYRLGLIRCALRAAHLSMNDDAIRILGYVSPPRYSFYALGDAWSVQSIIPWLLAVAIRAVFEKREPTLFDCMPSELWALVANEPSPSTVVEQTELLLKRLAEDQEASRQGNKVHQASLSPAERHHAPDKICREIRPLLDLARELKTILESNSPGVLASAAAKLFESWSGHQEQAKENAYDYRDKGRLLNEMYAGCALNVLKALGQLNAETVSRFRIRLEGYSSYAVGLRLALISQLATQPDCQALAGAMAADAVKAIQLEDDVTSRANLFARPARALLPADRDEARAQSRPRESEQGDKWSFCLTAGTLCPANQERQ